MVPLPASLRGGHVYLRFPTPPPQLPKLSSARNQLSVLIHTIRTSWWDNCSGLILFGKIRPSIQASCFQIRSSDLQIAKLHEALLDLTANECNRNTPMLGCTEAMGGHKVPNNSTPCPFMCPTEAVRGALIA